MMHLAARDDDESDVDEEEAAKDAAAALATRSVTENSEFPPSPLSRREIEGALHEGLRKEFNIADEYLEVVLHFTYFSFFGLVWPMGCLFALMNFLLEYRFDVAKLGQVRRRPMPKQDRNLRKLLKTFAIIISMIAIPFNVLMMLIPFEVLVVWFPEYFTEMVTVTVDGEERAKQQSMELGVYVPYWVLALFLTSLVLFACSFLLRLSLREIRRRDLKATLQSAEAMPRIDSTDSSAKPGFHGVNPEAKQP